MRKVAIVVDGLSELTKEQIKKYNIITVPYRIFFGEETYYIKNNNESELSTAEFCDKLKTVTKETFPRTSVPAPGDFAKAFDEALKIADSVIAIVITSGMSGGVQAAKGVVESLYKNQDITIFDSLHTMTGIGNLALEAAKMAYEKKSKAEILAHLEKIRPKTRYILAMKDLDFLDKQGRLGPIKKIRDQNPEVIPVIQEKDGILQPLTMFNNKQDMINRMKKFAQKICEANGTKDIFLTHINNSEETKAIYKTLMTSRKEGTEIHYYEACPILGAYSGPDSISISYIGEFENDWL